MLDTGAVRTLAGVTQTSQGVIPHLRHPDGYDMPVRVRVIDPRELPEPVVYHGSFVYVTPEGAEVCGGAFQ